MLLNGFASNVREFDLLAHVAASVEYCLFEVNFQAILSLRYVIRIRMALILLISSARMLARELVSHSFVDIIKSLPFPFSMILITCVGFNCLLEGIFHIIIVPNIYALTIPYYPHVTFSKQALIISYNPHETFSKQVPNV